MVDRVFNVGDFVLVFHSWKTDKLNNEWQGPFIITKNITDVTYKVDLGLERKKYRKFISMHEAMDLSRSSSIWDTQE